MNKSRILIVFTLLTAGAVVFDAGAAEQNRWPQWRGAEASGSVLRGTYPVKWDATNVLWKAPLPGKGCSTPVVWDRRIFLTAPVESQDAALAFDWGGKALWQTRLGESKSGKRQNSSGCNASPVTDGKQVFVYFKSGTLAALDFEGKVLWQTNLVAGFGAEELFWDQGTSPVLAGDSVVVTRMHHGESWVAAWDKVNGQLRWKVPRNYKTAVEGDNSYTTPLVLGPAGRETIVVWGGEHVTAYNGADGSLIWSCNDFNPKGVAYWPTVASPVLARDMVIVACGRADRGQPKLHGIKVGGKGDVTATHRLWKREDAGTFVPTPVVYAGRIYILQDRGEVQCLEPSDGSVLWRDALPKGSSSYFASPVIAGGRMYAAREDGVLFVAKVEGKFEVLAENRMDEQVIASPVPVGGRLLIRGERHLFCLGAK